MYSIMHRIEFDCSIVDLYSALTNVDKLSLWWTKATKSSDIITFAFGPNGEHRVDMQIVEQVRDKVVKWQCVEGPWADTTTDFTFKLDVIDRGCALVFENNGWAKQDDFFMHCNSKWGFFFTVSLKQYLESGIGQPHPQDPSI